MKNFIAILLLSFFSLISYASPQSEKEITTYIATFNSGSYDDIKRVLGELKWKGISDEAVFDALLKQFNVFKEDVSKYGIKKTAHIAIGLAASGNDKYKVILEKELQEQPNRHLKKYYKRAISEFDFYARINPVISKGVEQASDIETKRVKNMLMASDADIVVIGAKRVYHAHHSNKELLKLTESRLVELYPQVNQKVEVQAAAYLAKALARSGVVEYRELLQKVANTASSKKLRKYAKKYLKTM